MIWNIKPTITELNTRFDKNMASRLGIQFVKPNCISRLTVAIVPK